ncbi:hypothetical protein [Cryptosporidium parvum Iowa II]|uniref:Uncharacterized protein n=2 Tax=Cryptosporidium parvum TaxID=5807 RepID=Q5CPR1_CRYPI|nr:hypothetical protein [Cryptosporidium parvum Iowa II]EAK87410.1 hypothetical protein, signal peptide [Cryptosporidium parvum Iowa II]QOY42334.1 Uncharacterized protein CPATCC_0021650 [Cryptosporidium parvum]WKS77637.1 signal peptide-containing protein [Cryptosporidium sp. 43IA8]WRK31690.1 Uncharacterized protein cpbgf_4004380 [Cryptosporidium parvum]|eukprot:QOY42334.1 hypothetical protein CPATCC_001969 [Cryptosporidium parvum]
MKISIRIISFLSSILLLNGIESLKFNEEYIRKNTKSNIKLDNIQESPLLECTDALNSWSYFAKMTVKKLLDDEFKKDEYIFFLETLIPQISTIDESFNQCRTELLKYNISTKNETSQFKLEMKSKGEKEMVFNTKKSVKEVLKRIEELNKRNGDINDAKKLILNFDSRNICTECNIFSSQMALISVIKRLRLIYNSYITELESNIDPNILEEIEKSENKTMKEN